ncbi:MAG: Ig-like domain-containing protein, partial [Chitinophagales bacterium]
QNGKVTAVAEGTATITVTTEDGAKTATCVVTVTSGDVHVTGVTITPSIITLAPGGSRTLTANVEPSNATNKNVGWSSSRPSIATVDQNGKVTAVALGNATITVITEDGGYTADCYVTVSKNVPVTEVTVSPATLTIAPGNQRTLTATIKPTDATNKNVSWSSNANNVATVDQNGVVTAIAEGTATITATAEDGGFIDTCILTVSAEYVPVTAITLNKHKLELNVGGERETLVATISPSDATNKEVVWGSSDSTVAAVTNGIVTPVAKGTAYIMAISVDGSLTDTCEVVVGKETPTQGSDLTCEFDSSMVTNVGVGSRITVTALINNIGTGRAVRSTTKFSLLNNQGTEIATLAEKKVSSVSAGRFKKCSVRWSIPYTLTKGTYTLLAVADTNNDVTESNESNNQARLNISINVPELAVQAIEAPEQITAGKSTTISLNLTNSTDVTAKKTMVRLFWSTDNVLDAGDTCLKERKISIDASGKVLKLSVKLPKDTQGTGYLIGWVDSDQLYIEDNEADNQISRAVTVGVPE